jgi:hypothetical protein
VTLTAVKFAGEALVSKEMEEDAIIAVLPFIQQELVDYMAADLEDAVSTDGCASRSAYSKCPSSSVRTLAHRRVRSLG